MGHPAVLKLGEGIATNLKRSFVTVSRKQRKEANKKVPSVRATRGAATPKEEGRVETRPDREIEVTGALVVAVSRWQCRGAQGERIMGTPNTSRCRSSSLEERR